MSFKTLNIVESERKMTLWKENTDDYLSNELDSDYLKLRNRLLEAYEVISSGQKYTRDYQFGIGLYYALHEQGFSVRDAANDDVWRFLSLCVVPDLVGKRWGKGAEIRYYKQSGRIWLKTIWWYIYLSWQGDYKSTIQILQHNTTDQILQLVDRSGTKGYYVDVYRMIMYYYWVARRINPAVGEAEFRRIMTLHTAMCKTIEPGLYESGEAGYVKMLFERLGVDLNEE